MICLPVPESRLPVGSSARSSGGRRAIARATATRCCSPPGELHGIVMGAVGEADLGEERGRARERVGIARELERHRDVLERGERRDQVKGLEDVAEGVAPEARERVLATAA